jgi:ABC-type sugar transport system substrate-binding protein
MSENKLYATVLQDAGGQATTAFDLAYTMATKGAVNGATINGIKPLDKAIEEAPANDPALVKQIYLVPFKGVTKENLSTFLKK